MAGSEAQQNELREKVAKLVESEFGGDYHRAFDHYDNDKKDGKINRDELINLLKDARVGNWLTRGTWADGIVSALDADEDGRVSEAEFGRALK